MITETTPETLARTLFVSDMDGTLMGSDSRLSEFTANALNLLITRHDMHFTVATARTPATVVPLMSRVKARLPFVVMAGAALWNPETQAFEHVQAIDEPIVTAVIRAFAREKLSPMVYRRHGNRIHAHHCGALSAAEQTFVEQRQGTPYKQFLLNQPDYTTGADDEAMLIFAMNDYNRLKRVADDVREHIQAEVMLYHDIFDPATGLLEIYRAGTTKAAAIKQIVRQINAQRVVAFGDNRNDIAMLQAADLAVAVDNAVPEVKAVARQIIGGNTQDAVARFLLNLYSL